MEREEIIKKMLGSYQSLSRGDLQAEVEALALIHGYDADELLYEIDEAYSEQSENKPIKGFLFDTVSGEIGAAEVTDSLDGLHTALHCTGIEAVERRIGGRWFTVVCDEIGRLKPVRVPSGVSKAGGIEFVGSILLFKYADSPNFLPLSDEEIEHISAHVKKGVFQNAEGRLFQAPFIMFD